MRSPVPDLIHGLRCLSSILSKAESHCANRKIDPDALLKARLYPDMFNLTRNVTTACDSAKFTAARLSQTEPPRYEDNEASFAELQGRIANTIAFLETIPMPLSPPPKRGRWQCRLRPKAQHATGRPISHASDCRTSTFIWRRATTSCATMACPWESAIFFGRAELRNSGPVCGSKRAIRPAIHKRRHQARR
jgi:hypothetical protein